MRSARPSVTSRLPPFVADEAGVTATDAMLAVTAILKAVNVATFELGMWQAWTRG